MIVPPACVGLAGQVIIHTALYHRSDDFIIKHGHLVGAIREIAGMENVVPSLMTEGKAAAVLLALVQKSVIDNNRPRLSTDILCPIGSSLDGTGFQPAFLFFPDNTFYCFLCELGLE